MPTDDPKSLEKGFLIREFVGVDFAVYKVYRILRNYFISILNGEPDY